MSGSNDPNRVIVTTESVSLTTTYNGQRDLTQALVNAYYQGDIDAIRRIAHQVEQRLTALAQPREAS